MSRFKSFQVSKNKKLKSELEGNEIVGEIEFKEPIRNDWKKAREAENWARSLVARHQVSKLFNLLMD